MVFWSWLIFFAVVGALGLLPWSWTPTPSLPRWVRGLFALPLLLALIVAVSDPVAGKLASQFLMPLGLLWALVLSATASAAWAGKRWLAAGGALTLLLFTLAGSNWLGSRLLASIESGIPQVDPITAGPFDAVLVMGGGSYRRGDGQPEFGPAGDRLAVAAALVHAGRTPLLVASGDLAEDERWLWVRLQIPESAVLCLTHPNNTSEEVEAYRALIAEHGWKQIGLVTSAWHLPRALRLCARAGFAPTPIGADWLGVAPPMMPHEVLPSAEGVMKVQIVWHEWLGTVLGR